MTILLTPRWPSMLLLLLTVCGTGCSAFSTRPYPDKSLYALKVGPAPASKDARSPLVLRIQNLRVSPPFDSNTFNYKKGAKFTNDYYRGFIAAPAQLLTSELNAWLSQSGPFACVLDGASAADYQLLLEGNVTAFYGDYTPGTTPQAVLEVKFFVIDTTGNNYQVLFQKVYRQSTPLKGDQPDDLVNGWNQSCQAVFEALAQDLRQLPASPPVHPQP